MKLYSRNHCVAVFTAALLLYLMSNISPSMAQTAEGGIGSICVLAFDDANRNTTRDSGEVTLADVNVNVMVDDVIIANYVTDGQEPFCFRDLQAQQYTVSFSSPLYEATTLTSFNFGLAAGETRPLEFGAARLVATAEAPDAGTVMIPATTPVRVGISAIASIIVMVFVAALGLILYGLFGTKNGTRKQKPNGEK